MPTARTTYDQNSTQYAGLYGATLAKQSGYGNPVRYFPFSITLAAGTAPVTIGLVVLPPYSTILMFQSWLGWAGATATETLDVGWGAYQDANGATVAADDDGLIDGLLLTTDGFWTGGQLLDTSPTEVLPIVATKVFNNREEVPIFGTCKVANPGAGDTISGGFMVVTST